MNDNLVPPFIPREAGLVVIDVPKFHTRAQDLTSETHCVISSPDEDSNGTGLKIHMKLDGIFSYFPTCKLTLTKREECNNMETVYLTPDAAQ